MIYKSFDQMADALSERRREEDWRGLSVSEKKERRDRHEKLEAEITERFHQALAAGHGLKDHPREDKLWNMAWGEGHSTGYSEVECWYSKLSDLLIDPQS